MHRQLGDGAIAPDCRHRHLRRERRVVLLPCPLHVLLPRYPRFLGAGLHLSHLSHFRGPAQTSTASPPSRTSCSGATAATSNTSPVSTTSPPASERSTVSPNLVPSTAAPSEVSISSATPNRPCLPPCSVPPSTSPAFAAPISCPCSPLAHPLLPRNPHPTPRPLAPTRCHQAGHRHLSLLPHPRRPCRHCRWPPPH